MGAVVTGDVLAGRDRVLDAIKALALGVVVVAHSLAWDVSTGGPRSILDVRPGIAWITWTLQPLPLFFAAGAVANLGSWRRNNDASTFLRRRLVRLATPAVVYATVWTALLLPLGVVVPEAVLAGRFLSQLLWFLGVYAACVVAVPWTSRWTGRPVLSLGAWFTAIVAVDVVRLSVAPAVGWVNLLLVWGWLHQLGYHLPRLREHARALLPLAAVALGAAVTLAVRGPYSSSLVTRAGDVEASNLAPPTVVVALYGLAQVLVLAALWPALTRLLAGRRAGVAIAVAGSRAIGIYLWHIPWVAVVGLAAWSTGFSATPLGPLWWLAHALGLVFVLAMAWLTAGIASRAGEKIARVVRTSRGSRTLTESAPTTTGNGRARRRTPVIAAAVAAPFALLAMTGTGFATLWDRVLLGGYSSSAATLFILVGIWSVLARGMADATRPQPGTMRPGAQEGAIQAPPKSID